MKKMYFKHVALALGIVAATATAYADWSEVTNVYLKNVAFFPGWAGSGLNNISEGCGEAYDTPFEIYQVIPEAEAGKYTLTLNGFYRFGSIEESEADMKDGKNHNAYAFLGSEKKVLEGLCDNATAPYVNSMSEAAASFQAGNYALTVEVEHKGGDLKFGIANPVDKLNQWCIFGNVKLTGPKGDIEVPNGDFAQGISNDKADNSIWEHTAVDGSARTIQMNEGNGGARGCFRLTNASARNLGQLVTLPAGKYRLGMQSFFRHGNGNQSGWWIDLKTNGGEKLTGVETAWDMKGKEDPANFPILYVSEPLIAGENVVKPMTDVYINMIKDQGKLYAETPVKNIYDEQLDKYPDNVPSDNPVPEGERVWNDSGFEQQAMACFMANPDKYRNYVEFTLDKETQVWLGFKKDINAPLYWWWAFRNLTLEREVAGSGVAEIEAVDENAPVEYYNLQGIRVNNPENGLYIVKQGKKVSKKIFK